MSDGPTATVACPSCGGMNLPGSRFCSTCGTPLESAPPPAETRKTVTILFCDATSSTALGEQLDPESLRGLMTRYFDVMRQAIEFHGGVVEKFIGDAVMAVFGVPVLHEDDALRACRAAVEIRERLGAMDAQIRDERGVTIEWRMGINTGEVVAGDVRAGQRMVTGDAVNVAARLEAAAAPGETLLGPATHALVRDAVDAEAVEPLSLKGKAEPVPAWRLVRVAGEMRRQVRPLEAPLVGRRRPLRLLDEAFTEAVEERVCHLFTILGVAGVGKSRLVDEFTASLGDQATLAVGRCLAYGHGITYWPVAEAIRRGAGISDDDGPADAEGRLRGLLGSGEDADRAAAIVGGLLGIGESPAAPDETFWAIRRTFEAMARQKPLVLVFDDVHWGEPAFLDLVDHLADWTRDAPILLIAMARAELLEKRPAWGGGKRWVTSISLEPLSAQESDELVDSLLGVVDLPADVRVKINAAAEGNPLFVEELLGKLIDDGFLVTDAHGWSTASDLGQLAIPPSIQALLAARLDGLGPDERAVIERASVEGKTFHRGAVTELAPVELRQHVRDRLSGLMRMELVRPDVTSFPGDEAYRFRHLLIRDAAYQTLAKQTRSELHARFADWLERAAGERLGEYQEIVGYHLEQAYRYRVELAPPDAAAVELAARAGILLAEAGARAGRRGDVAAVVDLLGRATELLPEAESRRRKLPFHLANALYEAGQAARAESVLDAAVRAAEEAGDESAAALASAVSLLVASSTRSTELESTLAELERLAGILQRNGEEDDARFVWATIAFARFAIGRAREGYQLAQGLLERGPSAHPWYEEALQARGASMVYGPIPVDEATAEMERQISHSEGKAGLGPRLGLGRLLALQGRFEEALEQLAVVRSGFEELGNRHHVASATALQGEIAYLQGDLDAAARLTRDGFDLMIATGDRSFASTFAVAVARVLIDLGQLDEAERFGKVAVDTSSSDDVMSQAGGRAISGRVLSLRGEHDRAELVAREAERLMASTDYIAQHGEFAEDLAIVLHAAGKGEEAIASARVAADLYRAKGATFFEDRVNQRIEEWTA